MTLPRAAEWLLALAAPADLREAVAGDLVEMLGGEARPRLWSAVLRSVPPLLALRWERFHESRRPPALVLWLLGFLAVAVIHRLHDLTRSLVPMREGTTAEPAWMAAALAVAAIAGLLAGALGIPRSGRTAALAWVPLALAAVGLSSASYPALYLALLTFAPPALALAAARIRSSLP